MIVTVSPQVQQRVSVKQNAIPTTGVTITPRPNDALMAHIEAEDPHPQYLTQDEADARYATSAGALSYRHIQSVPSSVWTINHNLGYYAGGVHVMDSGGNDWIGEITHVDTNTLTIDFGNASFGGEAYIS